MRERTGVARLPLCGGCGHGSFVSRMVQVATEITTRITSDCERTAG